MDLYRTEGVLDETRTRSQKLLILGCGSLGSLVLGNLIYPWRQIVLVDPDELSVENLERHLLNQKLWVGQPKVTALAELLTEAGIDPSTIITYQGPAQNILDEHIDTDLVLVNLDRKRAKREVNAWCHEHNIAALYGSIYPKGSGGHILVVTKPRQACFICADHIVGSTEAIDTSKPKDYGVDITKLVEEDVKAVPALRAPISQVAASMSLMALEFLQTGELAPQIHYHGCAAWEPVGTFLPGELLDHFIHHLDVREQMGLVPTLKLEKGGDNTQTLLLRHGTISLQLRQWSKCPLHAEKVNLSDI